MDNKTWKEIYTCLVFIFWNLDGTYALKATWNENGMPICENLEDRLSFGKHALKMILKNKNMDKLGSWITKL